MKKLQNKVAVVTGGSSGIGFSTAENFIQEGAKVIITGRNQEGLNAAAAKLGENAMAIKSDASNLADIDNLVSFVTENYGKVDILFINAGIFLPTQIGGVTEEFFDIQMNINFKGAVFTLEKFIPILAEGASVINLSSINAYTGMSNTGVYAASKAALNSYTRTAATELAPKKIRINAVNPGPIDTPIFGKAGMSPEMIQGFAQMMQNRIPMKRFGKPEEISKLVTFLASDDASFITGSEYNIDGGMAVLV